MYHNTTNEVGSNLVSYDFTAQKQSDAVLDLFKIWKRLSPSHCHLKYISGGKVNTPLTSIRRSITDLTKEGKLEMTSEKMKGSYGRNEYIWKIVGY